MVNSHRHIHRDAMPPPGMLFHEVNVDVDVDVDKRVPGFDDQILRARQDAVPTEIEAPSQTKDVDGPLATASGEAEVSLPLAGDGTATQPLSVPTASETSAPSDDSAPTGLSPGATAGIAFGVLGGLLVIGLVIFLIISKQRKNRRNNDGEKLDDHHGSPAMANSSNSNAPRLSLRPVTQLFPGADTDKGANKGPGMAMTNTPSGRKSPGGVPFERPGTSQSSHYSENPFGSGAIRNPFNDGDGPDDSYKHRDLPPTPVEEQNRRGPPAGAAGAAGVNMTRKTSMRSQGARPTDYTIPAAKQPPPSPALTEFSVSNFTGGSSPVGPEPAAPNQPKNTSVHRVQLDFKPTLEDEMELKAGDLVRLLHEYDDGWALCIKLDRSQQGVVPRTCLSTRPVKPRNPNGSVSSRPGTSNGQNRPMSPGMGPRPHDPHRPQSPSGLSRQVSPPGPSPMNPAHGGPASLPGQAM